MSIEDRERSWLSAPSAGVVLVGTLILIYMVSQFLRGSVAVIAPDLARTIGLTASDLGLLSSVFFFVFAAVQLPLGVALDRFGPRLVLVVCIAIAVLGTLLFASATSASGLIFARALMGLGCSSAFMASLAVYARRFPPERFATLTGLHYGLGSIGSLLATAPLAWAAATIGWRTSFVVVAGVTVLIGIAVALVVTEASTARGRERTESFGMAFAGILTVLRIPSVGPLFLMNLAGYSSFALFVGLWGGPYLSHVFGLGLKERGDLLLIPALAQITGAFLWGPMDRALGGYRVPVLVAAVGTVLCLAVIAVFGRLPLPALIVWMTLFGVTSAFTPLLIGHGRALFPPHLIGRGLTLLNVGSIGGVFLAQAVSGLVIDLFPAAADGVYPLDAYRSVFALQGAFVLVAVLAYLGARDPRSQ
jgi:MFS family permease